MIHEQDFPDNQVAYILLKPQIDQTYPPGHFAAIHRGRIVGNAPSLKELNDALTASDKESRDVLVVQAGAPLPEITWIFLQSRTGALAARRSGSADGAAAGGGGLLPGADSFE